MYGDQFYHTTQMLFPLAIVIKQATGVWTLASVDKSQYDPLIDRVTVRSSCSCADLFVQDAASSNRYALQTKHIFPSTVLLFVFVGYFAVKGLMSCIGGLTETPCEKWYKARQERKIVPEDDGEKSAYAPASLCTRVSRLPRAQLVGRQVGRGGGERSAAVLRSGEAGAWEKGGLLAGRPAILCHPGSPAVRGRL